MDLNCISREDDNQVILEDRGKQKINGQCTPYLLVCVINLLIWQIQNIIPHDTLICEIIITIFLVCQKINRRKCDKDEDKNMWNNM